MADPKPITLTQSATNPEAPWDPQPYVVVSPATAGVAGLVTKQAAIADQAASTLAADFAAQKVQLDAVITKLNAVLAALRSAGIILP